MLTYCSTSVSAVAVETHAQSIVVTTNSPPKSTRPDLRKNLTDFFRRIVALVAP